VGWALYTLGGVALFGLAILLVIGFGWWWGMSPEDLYQLYHRLYTDDYR
jgi:hypothetical protein